MSASEAVSWPRRIAPVKRWRAPVNATTALPIAFALWIFATLGDYATDAEVGFTLLYLAPIGIAVWWRGLRAGTLIAVLCLASFTATSIHSELVAAGRIRFPILVWNLAGDVGVFFAFAVILDRLRVRIAREERERESAVQQLRHADRLNTIGKLTAGIAHELGTPLNVVSGHASWIASGRVAGEEAKASARTVVQQVERMTAIIKSLLAFSRRGGVRKNAIDLRRLVTETRDLLTPLAKKSGVEIVTESNGSLIAAVNAGEIQQVLTNLVMNALQAMPGGGKIYIDLTRGPYPQAALHGIADVSFAVIRVRDEGTGIAPDVLPHIFDPFFTTKDVGTGTGLGLSVSFGIVRDHGGFIEVSSEVGAGSEFIVYLPTDLGAETHDD